MPQLAEDTIMNHSISSSNDSYEDLPPKQIWATTLSSTSSEISPLREHQHSSIQARHVFMGAIPPALLCTPDSTQTTTEEDVAKNLGIAAAPFYGQHDLLSSKDPSSSSSYQDHHHQDEEQYDDDDDISSSIPSFNTRRMILDLQDELARTKAELEHLKQERAGVPPPPPQDCYKELQVEDEETSTILLPPQQQQQDEATTSSDHAVVVIETNDLPKRLQRAEQRVEYLQLKLKDTNTLARRLLGTLRRVKQRMQANALADLECHVDDVIFMEYAANLLLFVVLMGVPSAAVYYYHSNDDSPSSSSIDHMGLFALVIGVTFSAVEIAIRP